MTDDRQRAAALADWAAEARRLTWERTWDTLYQRNGTWFTNGYLDVTRNCLDRHLPGGADRVAIHWEGEPGDRLDLTYGELAQRVERLAQSLASLGVRRGDCVALHLGLLPETVSAMLACARLGAVHCVLPTTLPADALADRIADLAPTMLFTQDGAWRHGLVRPTKSIADEAVAATGMSVTHTVVVRRTGVDVEWFEGDHWYHDLTADEAGPPVPGTALPADDPLLALNVATRRGRPASITHRRAGFLVHAAAMHRRGLTADPDDVLWCAAELAWVGVQCHGIYGPLCEGATTVLFEGMLDTPTPERAWQLIDRYNVTSLATTPSVARSLRTWSQSEHSEGAAKTLRRIITIGEPIDQSTRRWLGDVLGHLHAPVMDGWGQTELGGIVHLSPPPVDGPPDAGLATIGDDNAPTSPGEPGYLVLTNPWPAMYLSRLHPSEFDPVHRRGPSHAYVTGDIATIDADRNLTVLRRVDPVIGVAGQLVSATEVRDVLVEHPMVVKAEVVARPHARTGQAVAACVVLHPRVAVEDPALTAQELRRYVRDTLGGLAQPRTIALCDELPDEAPIAHLRSALEMLCSTTEEWLVLTLPQITAALATVNLGSEAALRPDATRTQETTFPPATGA